MKRVMFATMLVAAWAAGSVAAQQQPAKASDSGVTVLGTVHIGRNVMADGKPLPAGTYQVRLTGQEAGPPAIGVTEKLERWVEFVQGGTAKGREVASILPAAEAKLVAKDAPPPANGVKLQTLKGGDYMRVWFNKGGNHYLIYFPVAAK